jgi:oxygen-independent coproporphyrinogen-3 oxidase
MRDGGETTAPVADWDTKRRWVDLAFTALEADGYHIGSAYTAAKGDDVRFVYRDGLWHGADLLGLGVASFSHLGGLHFQNLHDFEPYLEAVEAGRLPLGRALPLSRDELLIRELVLQLKLGRVETSYFADKFGVDIRTRFAGPLRTHQARGMLETTDKAVTLTRRGLLQVDALLADFFLDGHRGARYA